MAKVLLVEDDPALGKGLVVALEIERHHVTWARDLRSARDAYAAVPPQLILLDLNLPDGNGLSFLKEIRKSKNTPVIILTAVTDEESVVEGLSAGANDYVRKPFGQKELKARIGAVLRETIRAEPEILFGGLQIHVEKRRAFYGGREIELNRREFDILLHFMQRPDAVVSRESLLNLFDSDGEIFDRTIDSHVSHLRARLRKGEVEGIKLTSVYGVGYRLEAK